MGKIAIPHMPRFPFVPVHSTQTLHSAHTLHSTQTLHSAHTLHSTQTLHSAHTLHSTQTLHGALTLHSTQTLHSAHTLHSQGQNKIAIILPKNRDTAIFNRLYIRLYICRK